MTLEMPTDLVDEEFLVLRTLRLPRLDVRSGPRRFLSIAEFAKSAPNGRYISTYRDLSIQEALGVLESTILRPDSRRTHDTFTRMLYVLGS